MDTGTFAKYLNGNMTQHESETFETELKSDPALRREFRDFKKIWEASRSYGSGYKANPEKAWEKFRQKTLPEMNAHTPSFSGRMVFLKIAAAILILFAISAGFYFINPSGIFVKYTQSWHASDSILKIVLPDESVVWLNKNSSLKSPSEFTGKNRKVKLEGEAFFEIARNTEHPFIAEGEDAIVKVLGTSFNFRSTGIKESSRLIVKTGKVKFKQKRISSKSWILTSGEKICYNTGNMNFEKSKVENENYLAWKRGWLRFSGTPVKMVFEQLSEFYDKKFILKEDIPEDITLSGNFRTDSLGEIIELLELSLDLQIQKEENNSYIVQKSSLK